jgi:DNA-directed RNA polymerase specialized sigma24 family protein
MARSGGEPAVAEDLTQETFLAAVREIKRGRNPE